MKIMSMIYPIFVQISFNLYSCYYLDPLLHKKNKGSIVSDSFIENRTASGSLFFKINTLPKSCFLSWFGKICISWSCRNLRQ